MKQFFTLIILLLVLVAGGLNAQSCMPDSSLVDADFPVQPPPFDPTNFPDGGIRDTACINTPFDFVFSAVVGDTFNLGAFSFPMDSIRIPVTNGVINLPAGMSYGCNPGNCVFKKNTLGCINLFGTLTDPATIGEHRLQIRVEIFVNSSPAPLPFTLPDGQFIMGEYKLVVREESFDNCATLSTNEPLSQLLQTRVVPNPAQDKAVIQMESAFATQVVVEMRDLTGKLLMQRPESLVEGFNQINLDIASLPEGLLIYTIRNQQGSVSGKMVVSRR